MREDHANGIGCPKSGARGSCDVCGNKVAPLTMDDRPICQSCWDKRTNWDEGARSVALMALGNAVALARHWDVPEWAILNAVNISLRDPDGLHPDDAMGLGAMHPQDPGPSRVGR